MPTKERTVEEYMRLPYRVEVYFDENYWAAEFPDLPGLVAGAETWEELQAAIEDAKRVYFEAALHGGRTIPLPRETEQYSGKLVVRLAKSLHRQAVLAADREDVSLNAFIANAVAKELGRGERVPNQHQV